MVPRKGSPPVEYAAWQNMKSRCYNHHLDSYHNYGGRGITVCDRWKDSFENFLSDMGLKPSSDYSLDRIDPDGNYEPSNCRWADTKTQTNNKRKSLDQIYRRYHESIAEVVGLA